MAGGGATPEDPQPYLKTVMCRIVSIAAVVRKKVRSDVRLEFVSLPGLKDGVQAEGEIIRRFLEAVGNLGAQLVGFNSSNADLPILYQRALANRVTAPTFCHRPENPGKVLITSTVTVISTSISRMNSVALEKRHHRSMNWPHHWEFPANWELLVPMWSISGVPVISGKSLSTTSSTRSRPIWCG